MSVAVFIVTIILDILLAVWMMRVAATYQSVDLPPILPAMILEYKRVFITLSASAWFLVFRASSVFTDTLSDRVALFESYNTSIYPYYILFTIIATIMLLTGDAFDISDDKPSRLPRHTSIYIGLINVVGIGFLLFR